MGTSQSTLNGLFKQVYGDILKKYSEEIKMTPTGDIIYSFSFLQENLYTDFFQEDV